MILGQGGGIIGGIMITLKEFLEKHTKLHTGIFTDLSDLFLQKCDMKGYAYKQCKSKTHHKRT